MNHFKSLDLCLGCNTINQPLSVQSTTFAAMSSRHSERPVEISRVTRAGRTLTYSLKVIQQPERARACGSGAKCMENNPMIPFSLSHIHTNTSQHPRTDDLSIHLPLSSSESSRVKAPTERILHSAMRPISSCTHPSNWPVPSLTAVAILQLRNRLRC